MDYEEEKKQDSACPDPAAPAPDAQEKEKTASGQEAGQIPAPEPSSTEGPAAEDAAPAPQTSPEPAAAQAAQEEPVQEAPVLPVSFRTCQKMRVRRLEDGDQAQVPILFQTAKVYGTLLWRPEAYDAVRASQELVRLMEEDITRDETGADTASLLVPLDAAEPVPGRPCLVVDADLRNYQNGFVRLLQPGKDAPPVQGVYAALGGFVQALRTLAHHGMFPSVWDGKPLYFAPAYGRCLYLVDPMSAAPAEEPAPSGDPAAVTADGAAAVLLHALTGAWPQRQEPLPVPGVEGTLTFTAPDAPPQGEDEALAAWGCLPAAVRNAFVRANTSAPGAVSLEEWAALLKDAAAEVEPCVHCGRETSKTAERCLYCGASLCKENLAVRLKVEDSSLPTEFLLTLARRNRLYGCHIAPSLGGGELMMLMYNQKQDMLGLKNCSRRPWDAEQNGTRNTVAPGKILPLEPGMTLTFPAAPGVQVHVLGYTEYEG